MKRLIKIISLIIVLFLVSSFFAGIFSKEKDSGAEQPERDVLKNAVSVSKIGDLKRELEPIVLYGKVESSSSIDVVPEVSGVIKKVNKKLGSLVSAGEIVAELSNSIQYQNLLQARSAVESSDASLAKTLSGPDSEDISSAEINLKNKENSLAEQEEIILKKIQGLGIFFGDILTNKINTYFEVERGDYDFIPPNNSILARVAIEEEVALIEERKEDFLAMTQTLSANSKELLSAIEKAKIFLEELDSFTQKVQEVLSTINPTAGTSQSQINTWNNLSFTISSELNKQKVSLSSDKLSLSGAQDAISIAENNLAKIKDAVKDEDVAIGRAGLSSAKSRLSSAEISYAKTFIRSPIAGKISNISIRIGQLAGPSSGIFSVSNDSILQIKSFLSGEDLEYASIGSDVLIDGKYRGKINKIAPSVDKASGKTEVEISFSEKASEVKEGSYLKVEIASGFATDKQYQVPISAVFEKNGKYFVYLLSSEEQTVSKEVELVAVLGKSVVISSDFSEEESLVLNARGLGLGEKVEPIFEK